MLSNVRPNRILFLDIETASTAADYSSLDPDLKKQWELKFRWKKEEVEAQGKSFAYDEYFTKEAGLHAEWGKVICFTAGKLLANGEDSFKLDLETVVDMDEKKVLERLATILDKLPADVQVCAFNGLEFDVPYICRRLLINGLKIPDKLDMSDKKPWEMQIIDPMQLWRFGDRRHYCKLELLANLLGIPSPKDDLQGEDVSKAFWAGETDRIATYCKKDVQTLVMILMKMMNRKEQVII